MGKLTSSPKANEVPAETSSPFEVWSLRTSCSTYPASDSSSNKTSFVLSLGWLGASFVMFWNGTTLSPKSIFIWWPTGFPTNVSVESSKQFQPDG